MTKAQPLVTMLDHALAYAQRGYEVLPLDGKTPRTSRGFYDATTDEATIRRWWAWWPEANIGCRPPEGVIIFDIDPRNGGSIDSLTCCPPTRMARTGSGGWHVWFAATGKFRSSMAGVKGIDIKSEQGYVVMPPSIHPVTGEPYRWLPGNVPVEPLPEHLIDYVVKPAPKRAPRSALRQGKITDKQLAGIIRTMENTTTDRNNTLLWCACRLYEHDAGPEAFVQLELAASYTGLDDDEIARTIESAAGRVGR